MNVEQMLPTDQVEVALTFPRWRTILTTVLSLVVALVPIGYGFYVTPGGYGYVLLTLMVLFTLGYSAFVLRIAMVRLTGLPPALTNGGLRLRLKPWRMRVVDVSWARATMMWIDYAGRNAVLNLVPSGRIGRRAPRPDAPIRPYRIPIPPGMRPDGIRDAIRALSDGAADVLDRGLDYDSGPGFARRRGHRETPMPWWQVVVRYPVWALVIALGYPLLLAGPAPWNQPWWPGTNVAIRLPDPCKAVTGAEGTQVSGLPGTATSDSSSAVCRIVAGTSDLTVTYRVHHTYFGSSVTAAADDASDAAFQAGVKERLGGVGDEARIGAAAYGNRRGGAGMHVVARRANVVVEVRYASRDDAERVRTLVTETAKRALARVEVT